MDIIYSRSKNHKLASEKKEQENDFYKVCSMYNKCMAKLNSTLSTVSTPASTIVLTTKNTDNYPDDDLALLGLFSGESVSYRDDSEDVCPDYFEELSYPTIPTKTEPSAEDAFLENVYFLEDYDGLN